ALGTAWLLLALLPFNNVLPRFSIAMADRYLYVGAAGFGILAAALVERIAARPALRIAAASIIVAFFACTAFARTAVWRTSETLWRDAIAKTPDSILPRLQLGHALEWQAQDAH